MGRTEVSASRNSSVFGSSFPSFWQPSDSGRDDEASLSRPHRIDWQVVRSLTVEQEIVDISKVRSQEFESKEQPNLATPEHSDPRPFGEVRGVVPEVAVVALDTTSLPVDPPPVGCAVRMLTLTATPQQLDRCRCRLLDAALRQILGRRYIRGIDAWVAHRGNSRFKSKDVFARYNGTAPLPVWSSNKIRHRLSRVGNRQVNSAIHRIALTQARNHPEAQALLNRRTDNGNTKKEAMRVLKRRLSDVVYRAMLKDATLNNP